MEISASCVLVKGKKQKKQEIREEKIYELRRMECHATENDTNCHREEFVLEQSCVVKWVPGKDEIKRNQRKNQIKQVKSETAKYAHATQLPLVVVYIRICGRILVFVAIHRDCYQINLKYATQTRSLRIAPQL